MESRPVLNQPIKTKDKESAAPHSSDQKNQFYGRMKNISTNLRDSENREFSFPDLPTTPETASMESRHILVRAQASIIGEVDVAEAKKTKGFLLISVLKGIDAGKKIGPEPKLLEATLACLPYKEVDVLFSDLLNAASASTQLSLKHPAQQVDWLREQLKDLKKEDATPEKMSSHLYEKFQSLVLEIGKKQLDDFVELREKDAQEQDESKKIKLPKYRLLRGADIEKLTYYGNQFKKIQAKRETDEVYRNELLADVKAYLDKKDDCIENFRKNLEEIWPGFLEEYSKKYSTESYKADFVKEKFQQDGEFYIMSERAMFSCYELEQDHQRFEKIAVVYNSNKIGEMFRPIFHPKKPESTEISYDPESTAEPYAPQKYVLKVIKYNQVEEKLKATCAAQSSSFTVPAKPKNNSPKTNNQQSPEKQKEKSKPQTSPTPKQQRAYKQSGVVRQSPPAFTPTEKNTPPLHQEEKYISILLLQALLKLQKENLNEFTQEAQKEKIHQPQAQTTQTSTSLISMTLATSSSYTQEQNPGTPKAETPLSSSTPSMGKEMSPITNGFHNLRFQLGVLPKLQQAEILAVCTRVSSLMMTGGIKPRR